MKTVTSSESPASRVHDIRPLSGRDEAEQCARLMSSMDPWLTLGRNYEKCLAMLTDPAGQGKGTGRELIAFAEVRIAKVSPAVFMCVSSFNPRARALYERLGYEYVGELKAYVATGYSENLLWKRSKSWNEFPQYRP